MDWVTGVASDETCGLKALQFGVGDACPGSRSHRQPVGQEVLVKFGSAGDGEQRCLIGGGERLGGTPVRGAGSCLDRLQGKEHLSRDGVSGVGGLFQLADGAIDAYEQSFVDGKLAAGQAMQESAVKGDAALGVGQFTVTVDQCGVGLVQEPGVSVGPQGVDVMAGGGLDAVVE
ncbi:hypothetical protein J7I94_02150 [Streptomyces sp. ISL-12]|uniref:hypothetical protein n=1 Tax=Streptomyces sp. ISL-12 TaxID=2819177 RepID=UPI001BEBB4C8|nr:hypothetical protein [Streptomyces sp. ISL-12]MBT2409373.1 hypothetical protein [Streptomyces sp. ISL-12]